MNPYIFDDDYILSSYLIIELLPLYRQLIPFEGVDNSLIELLVEPFYFNAIALSFRAIQKINTKNPHSIN